MLKSLGITAVIVACVAVGVGALFVGGSGGSSSGEAVSFAPDFALLDQTGRRHELYRYRAARAVVVVSYDPKCSYARRDMDAIRALQKPSALPGVRFLMLNPAPEDREDGIVSNAADGPAVLADDAQLVSETLRFTRTGEALLLDPATWRIVYRGPIAAAGTDYLADALRSFLTGTTVSATTPPSVEGCATARAGDDRKGAEISYAADIVPLLQDKCIACHRAGGIAPWAMDSHAKVAKWSPRIRKAILKGDMPPWDADPHFGVFSNDRSLSAAQKRLLVRWIDAGARNDGVNDPLAVSPAPPAEFWPLGKPDLVVDLPVQQIPAAGVLDYRQAEVQVPEAEGRWLRAVDLKPSNPAVTHHITAWFRYAGDPPDQSLDEANGLTTYQPGHQSPPMPDDAGISFPKGASLILNFHYTTTGKDEADAPKLALYFRSDPPSQQYLAAVAHRDDFVIPPGNADYEVNASYVFNESVTLRALMPHMHIRGRRFRFTAHFPDGHSETLLSVPRYQFNWQTEYTLAVPRLLPAGTRIAIDGAFDNSPENPTNPNPTREVRWGPQSTDEMFLGIMMHTKAFNVRDAAGTAGNVTR